MSGPRVADLAQAFARCIAVVVASLATFAAPVSGQSYFARTFTEADGLSHQSILDLAQSSDGLLWLATLSGLVSYDGRTFHSESLPEPDETLTQRMRLAINANDELLAFRTVPPYQGYVRRQTTWQQLPHNPIISAEIRPAYLNTVCCLAVDGSDYTLLGANGGHLLLLGPSGWQRIPTDASVIRQIGRTRDAFVVVHDRGIATLDAACADNGLQPIAGTPDQHGLAAAFDEDLDCCWLLGRTWIGRYRDGRLELPLPAMEDPFFPDAMQVSLLPDGHDGIYIAERLRCLHYSPTEGLEIFDRANKLDDIGINHMIRDREGIIWAGGLRGLAKFAGRSMANRSSKHGLAADEVASILQLHDGRMVLGHDMAFTVLGPEPRTKTVDTVSFTRLMSMVQAPDGSIVAAGNRAGLLRIDPDSLAIETIAAPERSEPSDSPERDTVQSVHVAANGDIVVAGWREAWRLRPDGDKQWIDLGPLPEASYIRQIVHDGDGLLCAIRNLGVLSLHGSERESWAGTDRATQNLTCVSRRPDGSIWAGTAGGLLEAAPDGTLRPHAFGDDFIRRPVYSITDDLDGRTWFGTNDGVVIWDGNNLRVIRGDAGLAGRETNRGANLCDRDGNVWIGFDRGVTTFHLDRELPPRHGPSIAFLPPLVDGVVAEGDRWQHLVEHRSITFRIRSISMRDQSQLLHEYRLEGLDEQWSGKSQLDDGQILFHKLPPGRYRLHVRATDSSGLGTAASSPWLEVSLPWWRTWWFPAAIAAVVLLVVGGVTMFVSERRHIHTLRRTVEERTANLTTERNRLHAMLTSIADGVVGVDKDGEIRVWNPTATRLTGWSEEQVLGRPIADVLPPLDAPNSTRPGQAVQVATATGTTRWFEFTTASVTNAEDSGRVIAFRDVTDRRQQERLLNRTERLESLGMLAGGIAHDFNNLLTVMLGNLSLLELEEAPAGSDRDAETEQLQGQIREAVLRARDLTQQLLTFSKGGAPVRQLGSLAEVVVDSTQLALSGANVRSDVAIDDKLHDVEFDGGQIAQVVHNLVLNARQAMPDGGTLTVRGYNADRSPQGSKGPFAVLEIRDTGCGIAPDQIEHVFDPYYSTKVDGTGLGLATSHSIIQRHDGFLTVESRVGTGTTMRIHLPAGPRPHPEAPPGEGTANAKVAAAPPTDCLVLCMDDDPAIRSVMATSLQTLGHRAVVAADGDAAIRAYREAVAAGQPFDFVVLDLTVPGGKGGIETLSELQQVDPAVAAIATTGYSTEPVQAEFEKHGFRALLNKPFGMADVQKALADAAQLTGDARGPRNT